MPAITYTCPECEATLRPAKPIPAGKKIKCPNCGTIFGAGEEPGPRAKAAKPKSDRGKPAASPKPAPAAKKKTDEEQTYGFVHEEVSEEIEQQRKTAFRPLRDRFPKSMRGPAQAAVTPPSNWLMGAGLIGCLVGIFGGVVLGLWPMIFTDPVEERVYHLKPEARDKQQPPADAPDIEKEWKDLTDNEKGKILNELDELNFERWIRVLVGVIMFLYFGVITVGAIKMQALEAYPLAMTAAIMALVGALAALGFFIWGIIYLVNQDDLDPTWVALVALAFIVMGSCLIASIKCLVILNKAEAKAGYFEKPED